VLRARVPWPELVARARRIEGSESAAASAHIAVRDTASVNVRSRDRARGVEALGEGALTRGWARAGRAESDEAAVPRAQEPVSHNACTNLVPIGRPRRVDALGKSALAGSCTCVRGVEGGGSLSTCQSASCFKIRLRTSDCSGLDRRRSRLWIRSGAVTATEVRMGTVRGRAIRNRRSPSVYTTGHKRL
jgi:hypothetical protein